jgi:hypothetical protein
MKEISIRLLSIDKLNKMEPDKRMSVIGWLEAAWDLDQKDLCCPLPPKPERISSSIEFMNGCIILSEWIDGGVPLRSLAVDWWAEDHAKARALFYADIKTFWRVGAKWVFDDDPMKEFVQKIVVI